VVPAAKTRSRRVCLDVSAIVEDCLLTIVDGILDVVDDARPYVMLTDLTLSDDSRAYVALVVYLPVTTYAILGFSSRQDHVLFCMFP
jgi:hypothetical protein